MDAEFILVSNGTKSAQTYWVLAEKWQFFQRVLKMADFGQHAKEGPIAKFSKWPIFLADLRKLQKIANTSPISVLLVWMDAKFILVSNDTKSAQT